MAMSVDAEAAAAAVGVASAVLALALAAAAEAVAPARPVAVSMTSCRLRRTWLPLGLACHLPTLAAVGGWRRGVVLPPPLRRRPCHWRSPARLCRQGRPPVPPLLPQPAGYSQRRGDSTRTRPRRSKMCGACPAALCQVAPRRRQRLPSCATRASLTMGCRLTEDGEGAAQTRWTSSASDRACVPPLWPPPPGVPDRRRALGRGRPWEAMRTRRQPPMHLLSCASLTARI